LDESQNIISVELSTPIEFTLNLLSGREKVRMSVALDHRLRKIGFLIDLQEDQDTKLRVFKVPRIIASKFASVNNDECFRKIYTILENEIKVK
jgi:hypothetical protein